jgi:pimeloyl-ACP methyl ester carboxylesterase
MPVDAQNTPIVIRHGIFSDKKAMSGLEAACRRILPNCQVDNETYRWQDSILHSGVQLAQHVGQLFLSQPAFNKLILIGHSQGGLVCRIAAAALLSPSDLLAVLQKLQTSEDQYYGVAIDGLRKLVGQTKDYAWPTIVVGVAMLATPNSGAITYGQLSLQAQLAVGAAKHLASLGGWKNFDELTTDKLFRIFQRIKIADARYLSISGSRINKYRSLSARTLSSIPVIGRLGLYLDLPNDLIVEDSSVDISKAPLPSEIADLTIRYRHVRTYTDCTDVTHIAIHSNSVVEQVLGLYLPKW